jgi:hypothetical protein
MLCILTMLEGCLGGGGGGGKSGQDGGSEANLPPTITGSPWYAIRRKEQYVFQPSASDPDGDPLRFSIHNKPPWTQFNAATGKLTGTPKLNDVGEYIDITISVTDGELQASLQPFSITVYQSGEESVTLSWMPPTENADGSVLKDLNGYYIYLGQSEDAMHRVIQLKNEGLTRYVIEKLYPATWYFAMSSYNKKGRESKRTRAVSKIIG